MHRCLLTIDDDCMFFVRARMLYLIYVRAASQIVVSKKQ